MRESTVQELAKAADISRATAYTAIESLTEKGLITAVQKGSRKYFQAESPERLSAVAKAEAARIQALASEIAVDIDELKLAQSGDKPIVKLYEGEDALLHIMEDIQKTKPKEILEMENLDEFMRLYQGRDFSDHYQFLEKTGIERTLLFAVKDRTPSTTSDLQQNYIIEGQPEFFGAVTVYANKVVLSAYRGQQVSVLIESEVIANMMREMFTLSLQKKTVSQ
jgi:sugar-specific transcriptional regulator TrmB